MTRCRLGAALLALLLAALMLADGYMARHHMGMLRELGHIDAAAETEDWPEAEYYVNLAKENWDGGRKIAASLTDQSHLEQIEVLFSLLTGALRLRDPALVRQLATQLSAELERLAESHRPNWWNIL